MRKAYRRFKKRYRLLHVGLMAIALVMLWWATWNLLDVLVPREHGVLGYVLGFAVAFVLLYLDGFHLKELE